jgi:hypothetical protein
MAKRPTPAARPDPDIPELTEVVGDRLEESLPADRDILIAELQTALAARTFVITEEAIRGAFSEMEAQLFQHVAAKLRQELPELIDSVLREHLEAPQGD